MWEDTLSLQTHDRIAAIQCEAEVYRQMIDAAPLRFRGHGPLVTTRRVVAGILSRLASAIDP